MNAKKASAINTAAISPVARNKLRLTAGATSTARKPVSKGVVRASAASQRRITGTTKAIAVAEDRKSTETSKQARLIALLKTKSGATIAQLIELTGWQAHTVRGTISGVLRKKLGLDVACVACPKSGERRYLIARTVTL